MPNTGKNKVAEKDKNQEALKALAEKLNTIEDSLKQVHSTLTDMGVIRGEQNEQKKATVTKTKKTLVTQAPSGKVIEGTFDGQNMIGPNNKIYPVPANYASKSKLVEGDTLKLTIAEDGSFIYKQIGPVERKKLIGKLKLENDQYLVEAGGHDYRVLFASVTYFKANPSDEVTIVVPENGQSNWAAIEAVIS